MTHAPTPNHPHPFDLAASLPVRLPEARIRYSAESPVQYGDLRLPKAAPPPAGFPVIVFVHGGGWTADWSKDYASPFVEALAEAGFATWDLEFRRLGNLGGGYPGTFHDVAAGADHLSEIALHHPLDLRRVIAIGHSTGGHLALWLAGRRNLPAGSALYTPDPLPLKGVISLGGVNDLEASLRIGNRTDILPLLGVSSLPEAMPRFAETSPAQLLPFGIPQVLVAGSLEDAWRKEMTASYAERARQSGDAVDLVTPEGIDHFDIVDAQGPMLAPILGQARRLVGS